VSEPQYKIDKGIPVPPKFHQVKAAPWSRFAIIMQMEVGDSMLFPTHNELLHAQSYARSKFGTSAMRQKKMEDGSGYRIWRIA
jgi:hypothetical protein